jgi:hypothetical protein
MVSIKYSQNKEVFAMGKMHENEKWLAMIEEEFHRFTGEFFGWTVVLGSPFDSVYVKFLRKIINEIDEKFHDAVWCGNSNRLHVSLGTVDKENENPMGRTQKGPVTRDNFLPTMYEIIERVEEVPKLINLLTGNVTLSGYTLKLSVKSYELPQTRTILGNIGITPLSSGEKKDSSVGHITLGVLKKAPIERYESLERFLHNEMSDLSRNGCIVTDSMAIVHYATRSLNTIMGKVVLKLGEENNIAEDIFWRQLMLPEK